MPLLPLEKSEIFRKWEEEKEENEIKIFNSNGDYLFSIEKKDGKESKFNAKELYYNAGGIQWFESGAKNYHKLLDVNPDLKDKEKCKKLGVLYFTWRDIVEFAEVDRMSISYGKWGSGNWKKVEAKGYILVSMEGIPYWADAVGQIPYAIDVYRAFYRQYGDTQKARNGTIKLSYRFADGTLNNPDSSNSCDNAMILRGINWAEKRYYKPNIDDCIK